MATNAAMFEIMRPVAAKSVLADGCDRLLHTAASLTHSAGITKVAESRGFDIECGLEYSSQETLSSFWYQTRCSAGIDCAGGTKALCTNAGAKIQGDSSA
jgi:hypothetical protein